jgi:cyclopropane-fatty-acyl-phospholipid synthase
MWYDSLLKLDLIPDFVIRSKIRKLNKDRLSEITAKSPEDQSESLKTFINQLHESAIAVETAAANDQHYELPPEFFELCLGPHRKYSCAYYEGNHSLEEAEVKMLDLYVKRAQIAQGQEILELGCGWGSLTMYLAEKFPDSNIVGISNSHSQREYIEKEVQKRDLKNIRIQTADVNLVKFSDKSFDRVISIEMLEHIRNYKEMFKKISAWLKTDGLFFNHIFTHKDKPYLFEVRDESDWMSKYFFTGGVMPSNDLFLRFQDNLKLEDQWLVSGKNYQKTSEDWLKNLKSNKGKAKGLLRAVYGKDYSLWYVYWKIFYMAVAELFGTRNGKEWMVSHYLFSKR